MLITAPKTITPAIVKILYSDRELACTLSEYNESFRGVMKKQGLQYWCAREWKINPGKAVPG